MSCSTCFASVISVAPTTAPHTLPAPPTTAMNRYSMPWLMPNGVGIHEALQVRVEPARHRREQRRVDEHDDLEPRRVDAEGLGHLEVAAQRADGASRTRIEQVARRPQRHEREAPDQEVVVALVPQLEAEEVERGNAGESRVAAEELEIAEQKREADAPRDRRERKVVAFHPQRDEAEAERERQREGDADAEVDPRRQPEMRREDGRGVRADADERRLAERRLSRHAGEQHETERHHAVEPDVIAERHPELRRDERDADQHRDEAA